MLNFWNNPELVRHRRAELRRSRAIGTALVVVALCILIGLACWAKHDSEMQSLRRYAEWNHATTEQIQVMEQRNPIEFWFLFYRSLIYAQLGVLTFWVLFSCAQSVSAERERKTWDFQRTTRLQPRELLIGKLFGEPVLAYFVVLCCMPITVVAGLLGEAKFLHIVYAYTLIFSSAIFLGLIGLWISSLFESRSRGVGLIGTIGIYAIIALSTSLAEENFPGFAALSPLTGIVSLLRPRNAVSPPAIFNHIVPWVFVSLLLYVLIGVWFVVMLLRNLKRERDDIHLLSRWQVVGCAALLNFLAYALFHPNPHMDVTKSEFVNEIVGMNIVILLAMGLATLTAHERLKVWWRQWRAGTASLFSNDGLAWPWLALSTIVSYGLLIWGVSAWHNRLLDRPGALQMGAIQLLGILIFITRDVLFIQWCMLTRMRMPLVKGVLYLALYYVSAAMIATVLSIGGHEFNWQFVSLTTPVGVFGPNDNGFHFPATVFAGMAIQLAIIMGLLMMINRRLSRSAAVSAIATG